MNVVGKSRQAPPAALGLRKDRWLLAQESLGTSERESKLSPTDDSLAFPGCKASGLAALPPGQKHHGTKPDFRVIPGINGNQANLTVKQYPLLRSRRLYLLVQVHEGRTADDRLWRKSHRR